MMVKGFSGLYGISARNDAIDNKSWLSKRNWFYLEKGRIKKLKFANGVDAWWCKLHFDSLVTF